MRLHFGMADNKPQRIPTRCNGLNDHCSHCEHARPHYCKEPDAVCIMGDARKHQRVNVTCETLDEAPARRRLQQAIAAAQRDLHDDIADAQRRYDDAVEEAQNQYDNAVGDAASAPAVE
jgi:hypothetical protein